MGMPHLAIISRIVLTSLSVPGLKPAWAPLWWKSHQYLDANNEAIIIKTHCKFSEGIHKIAVNLSLSISICLYHHISTPLIIVIIVLASVPRSIDYFNKLIHSSTWYWEDDWCPRQRSIDKDEEGKDLSSTPVVNIMVVTLTVSMITPAWVNSRISEN